MDPRAQVIKFLPALRRYAQAYAGCRQRGDAYVEICLEVLTEDPRWLQRGKTLKLDLFKLLHAVIDRCGEPLAPEAPAADYEARLRQSILGLAPLRRRLVLLLSFEDLQTPDLAYIMGLSEAQTRTELETAWSDIGKRPTARVLIVEDEELIAMDMSDTVEELGHTVVGVAKSEQSAVDMAYETSPELVLADVRLRGGGNGARAIERIIGRNPGVPVIFVTGHPDGVHPDAASSIYCVAKPFNREVLKQTIAHALKKSTGPRPLYM
jgi:CheY-like chemotaxis protein/DNA-directed RNA polymerase specialized sigma24 family protein